MNEQQPRPIWGLNFLQDMKGYPDEITGAYDPEQEVWIMQGQVQSSLLSGGISEGKGALRRLRQKSPPRSTDCNTTKHTYRMTHGGDTSMDSATDNWRD